MLLLLIRLVIYIKKQVMNQLIKLAKIILFQNLVKF